jgi:hypothetical protein
VNCRVRYCHPPAQRVSVHLADRRHCLWHRWQGVFLAWHRRRIHQHCRCCQVYPKQAYRKANCWLPVRKQPPVSYHPHRHRSDWSTRRVGHLFYHLLRRATWAEQVSYHHHHRRSDWLIHLIHHRAGHLFCHLQRRAIWAERLSYHHRRRRIDCLTHPADRPFSRHHLSWVQRVCWRAAHWNSLRRRAAHPVPIGCWAHCLNLLPVQNCRLRRAMAAHPVPIGCWAHCLNLLPAQNCRLRRAMDALLVPSLHWVNCQNPLLAHHCHLRRVMDVLLVPSLHWMIHPADCHLRRNHSRGDQTMNQRCHPPALNCWRAGSPDERHHRLHQGVCPLSHCSHCCPVSRNLPDGCRRSCCHRSPRCRTTRTDWRGIERGCYSHPRHHHRHTGVDRRHPGCRHLHHQIRRTCRLHNA